MSVRGAEPGALFTGIFFCLVVCLTSEHTHTLLFCSAHCRFATLVPVPPRSQAQSDPRPVGSLHHAWPSCFLCLPSTLTLPFPPSFWTLGRWDGSFSHNSKRCRSLSGVMLDARSQTCCRWPELVCSSAVEREAFCGHLLHGGGAEQQKFVLQESG